MSAHSRATRPPEMLLVMNPTYTSAPRTASTGLSASSLSAPAQHREIPRVAEVLRARDHHVPLIICSHEAVNGLLVDGSTTIADRIVQWKKPSADARTPTSIRYRYSLVGRFGGGGTRGAICHRSILRKTKLDMPMAIRAIAAPH